VYADCVTLRNERQVERIRIHERYGDVIEHIEDSKDASAMRIMHNRHQMWEISLTRREVNKKFTLLAPSG
jgi:hypothetical protein